MRYEEIEHTADVGIRAYGKTPGELFANAAEGMFSLIADLKGIRPIGEVRVQISADDLPTLLVRWLTELLFLHETQNLLLCSFRADLRGTRLEGTAQGEGIDKARHELKLAIKAVTYHGLVVDPDKGVVQVIFDI